MGGHATIGPVTSDVRIRDVEAGRPVEGVYAVARKQRRHDRNGDPYLVLELTDSTGSIEGRVWKNADWFDRNIREGDKVMVTRNDYQIDLFYVDVGLVTVVEPKAR